MAWDDLCVSVANVSHCQLSAHRGHLIFLNCNMNMPCATCSILAMRDVDYGVHMHITVVVRTGDGGTRGRKRGELEVGSRL